MFDFNKILYKFTFLIKKQQIMTKKRTYLFGILLTILIGTVLYYYLCCNCSECFNDKPEFSTSNTLPEIQKGIFSLKGEDIDYHCKSNFNFLNNNFKTILPVIDSINIGVEKLKTVLEKGGQKVNIIGYYLASEKNNSAFENLGLARAVDVKNYFVSKGISAVSITTNGVVKNVLNVDNTTVYGPVDFSFTKISSTPRFNSSSILFSSVITLSMSFILSYALLFFKRVIL